MANRLKMADIHAILALKRRKWSNRRIAAELDVDRETVARYVRLAAQGRLPPLVAGTLVGESPPKPANAPAGKEIASASSADGLTAEPNSKPANAPADEPVSERGPYSDAAAANAAIAPLGNFAELATLPTSAVEVVGSKPAIAPAGELSGELPSAGCGRLSDCEAYREQILGMLELGLSAQRIYQDLVAGGFSGSYYSVRRFTKHLREERPEAFRRLECAPGEEAQVDFGSGATIVQGDQRRRPHVFRIVLSHSRKGYSEASYRQTTEDFIRCLENAFWHFGGVPQTLVIDNLKAAVVRCDWFDPDLHPKLLSFCQHYGTTILPTKPFTPRHKGKIERGVDYVKENGLKGHVFESLEAENSHLLKWETRVADQRIHGTTRQQVAQRFEAERPALLPLPAERFAFFHEAKRTVHRDGHVEVAKAYYSAPPEYVGREVWARWDGRLVRVFNLQMEEIAVHVQHEPGKFSTNQRHLSDRKISTVERGAEALMVRVACIGRESGQWGETMLKQRGVAGMRVLLGLLDLAKKHPSSAIEQACRTAHSFGAYRLKTIRKLIGQSADEQATLEFIDEHPIIRSLGDYGDIVRQALDNSRELAAETIVGSGLASPSPAPTSADAAVPGTI